MSIEYEKTNLLLGDIIEIYSPSNKDLHDKQFIIEYIDDTKIELLNEIETQND